MFYKILAKTAVAYAAPQYAAVAAPAYAAVSTII